MLLSMVVAGMTCIFAALCYAEFAAMVPIAGSAYTYAYATLGELFAWIIGWDLVSNMPSGPRRSPRLVALLPGSPQVFNGGKLCRALCQFTVRLCERQVRLDRIRTSTYRRL